MHAKPAASPLDRPLPALPAGVGAPGRVPAVSRALNLLDRLARQRAPMTLARLAADLALPKSSVHGLCSTLVSFGYLRRQSDGAFLIGPRVMTLADAFVASTNVTHEFDSLWTDSGAQPEETMILSVLAGTDVIYVGARNGSRPLGLSFSVGMRLPAHLSATGQAQLAFHSPDEVARLFAPARGADPKAVALQRLTGRGPATLAELTRLLQRTRRRGHSLDDEGIREGVVGIGAAVFDVSGKAVAGVGVCLHKPTLDAAREARQRAIVLDAARTMTQRLGGVFPGGAEK
jgi:IclR family transcriptional regulator, blcABC operon repressor